MKPADPMLTWTIAAAIGQIAGAIATAAAVVVSLWIVISERRGRLRVTVGHRVIVQADEPQLEVVAFDVTNLSLFPVRVTTISWHIGWFRSGPAWARTEAAIQRESNLPGLVLPATLEPGERSVLLVQLERFSPSDAASADLFRKRLLPFGLTKVPPISVSFHTSRGAEFRVRIERHLREKLVGMQVS